VHPPKVSTFDVPARVNIDNKGLVRPVDEYRETPFGLYMSRAMVNRSTADWMQTWLLPELGIAVTDWWWKPGHVRDQDFYVDICDIARDGDRWTLTARTGATDGKSTGTRVSETAGKWPSCRTVARMTIVCNPASRGSAAGVMRKMTSSCPGTSTTGSAVRRLVWSSESLSSSFAGSGSFGERVTRRCTSNGSPGRATRPRDVCDSLRSAPSIPMVMKPVSAL
jgi:hypothetical protein